MDKDVKKKYVVFNSGSEGRSSGIIFLTKAEAELINRVSDKKNWDKIIIDEDYDGRTYVRLYEEGRLYL